MRLHRLRVTAFGPYAGTEEVDLDDLAGHGLFLLHGPTGAGKTSVLDAICFALYGRVPGARQGAGSLRSDHAPPGVAPEVAVELTAAGRRLEVTRSPAWERPKRRGTGTTTQPAATRVTEWVDGAWQPRSSRNDDAALLLDDVLGMGLEQFTRVVLLPQGDFAAFLRARAEDRRALLQRLFGTDRFAAVETWLAERRTALRRDLERADSEVVRLVARAHQAAGGLWRHGEPAAEDVPGVPDAETDPGGHVEALAALAAARAEGAAAEEARTRLDADTAAAEVTAATRRARLLERLAGARREAAALQSQRGAVAAARAALDRDAAARSLRGHLDAVAAAQHQADAAADATKDARDACDAAGDRADDPGRLAATAAALRREAGALVELLASEAELARLRSAAADLAGRRDAVRQRTGGLAERIAGLTAAADLAEVTLAATTGAEDDVAARRADLVAAEAAHAAAVEAAAAASRVDDLRDREREAVDAAQRTRQRWHDLREHRLAGMAAELAASLAADEPCPVCGSPAHPDPAAPAPTAVRPEQEEEARVAYEAAAEHRAEVERSLAAAAERHALADRAAAGVDVTTALARVAAARLADQDAEGRAARREAAHAQARSCRERLAPLHQEHDRHLAAVAGADAELAALRDRVAALDARLDAARGGDDSLTARRDRLEAAAGRADDLRAASTARDDAQRALARCRDAGDAAAARAGFADLATAAAAVLPDAERAGLQERVQGDADRRAALAAALADPELADAELADAELADAELAGPELAGPELAADRDATAGPLAAEQAAADARDRMVSAAEAAARARTAHEEATRRCAVAQRARDDLADVAAHVAAAVAAAAPLRDRHDVVADLAACAAGSGGDNALRMRLSAFVLAARLEQVADAATVRLAEVSGGRYALRHSDAAERGGARSGLGLVVLDSWTGSQRDPASLSGGETFLASLSLALGLADVVQAEAGGGAIETLFVDEGFGSLDEESLDEAMGVLDGLREGGRAVGVVSHVADLRQRVPARLEVTKTRRGSHLRVAHGAA